MDDARCPYCGGPLPAGPKPRIFCRERCRRKWQDARRRQEREEERSRRKREPRLIADAYARNDLGEYEREAIFANCLIDAAPVIGPGDREETLKKRAARRPQATKQKTRQTGKAKTPKAARGRTVQLSLLALPALPEPAPLVRGRGWKKNWLTLC